MKDENNLWFIKSYKGRRPLWNDTQPITLVRNGDFVRLDHLETARNLHSHRKPSPITKSHLQVTAYGEVIIFYPINTNKKLVTYFITAYRMVVVT